MPLLRRGRIAHRVLTEGFLLLFSTVAGWAQANSATFYGSVTDPTGAVVPAAVVTLVAQDTGTNLRKVTDDSGDFAFTFVPVGTYTLRIEAKGFLAGYPMVGLLPRPGSLWRRDSRPGRPSRSSSDR